MTRRCWGLWACLALWPGPAGGQEPPPTFAREIAPLIHRRCSACHRPGQPAPFPLLGYRDVQKRAAQILDVTERRLMPPWAPEPGYGEFDGARRLDDTELALLRRWVAAGAPEGDAASTPAPPTFADDWQLGQPDLVVTMRRPYAVKAEGRDVFRNFVLPLKLAGERWLAGAELRAGASRVLHHAFVTIDAHGRGRAADEADAGPGFGGLEFGAGDGVAQVWAPGATPHRFPAGTGLRVPAGSDVVLQLHVQPSGAPESVQCEVGLFFHEAPPPRAVLTLPLAVRSLHIPAGAARHEVLGQFPVLQDLQVLAVFPHMHALGREVQVVARTPDRTAHPLVWIKRWSFARQDLYQLRAPLALPRGSRVEARFVFDNSADNPENPHVPPRPVSWGANATDEMALVLLQVLEPPKPRR